MSTLPQSQRRSLSFDWDALLSRTITLNWEVVAYTVILILAIATRFYDLGTRVMSHDESLHTYYSWLLYDRGEFDHTPLMHGPLLFHATAFFYYLFGDNDFSARIYTSLLGVGIVLSPLLFRQWLGRYGAVIAAIGLLISPMLLYYNRYIRHDTPNIFYMLVMVWAFMQYVNHAHKPRQVGWLVLASAAMLLMLASKEVAFMYIAIFGSFLTFYWIMRLIQDLPFRYRRAGSDLSWHPPVAQWLFGHALVVGAAVLVGFLLGELLYFWQYATMGWVWVAVGLALVLLVRGVALGYTTLLQALQSNRPRDIMALGAAFLLVLGSLLAFYGAVQHQSRADELRSLEPGEASQGLTAVLELISGTRTAETVRDERDTFTLLGGVGLGLSVLGLGLWAAVRLTDPNRAAGTLQQRQDGRWALGTVLMLGGSLAFLLLLRFLSSSWFLDVLEAQPFEEHLFIDTIAILSFFALLSSVGIIRSAWATLRTKEGGWQLRAGVAQMFVEGLGRTHSAFLIIIGGTVLGTVICLHVFGVLDIIKPDQLFVPVTQEVFDPINGVTTVQETDEVRVDARLGNALLVWIGVPVMGAVALVIVAAALGTPRRLPMPWQDILALLLVATIVGGVLIYAERQSHIEDDDAIEEPVAVDPNAPAAAQTLERQNGWIVAATLLALVGAVAVGAWRTLLPSSWGYLNRQPIFDVLMMMGIMILPWLSAFPVYLAGYTLDAAPLPTDTVRAIFWVTGSWLIFTAVVGISWNWKLYVATLSIFMALFLFFFTTVFTNGAGVFTGMVGSLGYWLEQQGVRRGSQPQYYYTLIQVPVYEFAPLILSALAGVAGLIGIFRVRAQRHLAELETSDQAARLAQAETGQPSGIATGELDMDRVMSEQPPLESLQAASRFERPVDIPNPRLLGTRADQNDESDALPLPDTHDDAGVARPGLLAWWRFFTRPYSHEEELVTRTENREWLGGIPFVPMTAYWAMIIFVALTYAGEKMPWLTTHITTPLILVAGWFIGLVVERVRWQAILRGGWALLLLLVPVLMIASVEVVRPLLGGDQPFGGMQQAQLDVTYAWLAAVLVWVGAGYFAVRMAMQIGLGQAARLAMASVAILLGLLTARVAILASFENYDYPTEYLVYAHSGPAVKTVLEEIEYIAERTNQGQNLRVAYDEDSSWPMTWYLREYNTAFFTGSGEQLEQNPGVLDGAQVVVVGSQKNAAVDRLLGDTHYRFDYIRLWWPMQEYFNLSYDRLANLFGTAANSPESEMYRQGIWNIWWERDYELYGQAQCVEGRAFQCSSEENQDACYSRIISECRSDNRYDLQSWPVSDPLYLYVDREIAAQIWDAGLGGESVASRLPEDAITALFQNIAPALTFGAEYSLSGPRGLDVGPDGQVYVADTNNSRVVAFSPEGALGQVYGVPATEGNAGLGTLLQPWGVEVGPDSRVYVADTWNHRVQVFGPDGEPLLSWGEYGTPADDPGNPWLSGGRATSKLTWKGTSWWRTLAESACGFTRRRASGCAILAAGGAAWGSWMSLLAWR
ncbi:MAG: TIGR03663 family protein [Anaerolineae bacterium]|nr:TIGR03663 family protein [Anaerolineae bacterium]